MHVSSIGNDALFGTTGPKRVGDTWNVEVEVVNRLLAEMEAKADRAEISGMSTLEKVERGHLTIRSFLSVTNAFLPTPTGFTPESCEIHTEATGRYPTKRIVSDWGAVNKISIRTVDKGRLESGVTASLVTEYKSNSQFEITPLRGH